MAIPINSTQLNSNGLLFTQGLYVSGSGSTFIGNFSVQNLSASTITIGYTTSSESSSNVIFSQILSSSTGTGQIDFGIKNNYYGTIGNIFPSPYGSTEYRVVSTGFTPSTKRIDSIGYVGKDTPVTEKTNFSTKDYSAFNNNFTHRKYVMNGTTVGYQNVYLSMPESLPPIEYVEMPSWESWNFTLRVIARKKDQLQSDAFFINGYCDNYGSGTINGQYVQTYELASPGLAQYLNVVVEYDQNGGANNYFRVQCQSNVVSDVVWMGYLDVIAVYASASARAGGAGAT